jgi:anti-anti-sigma factor
MQITSEDHGDLLELRIDGRLDNEWADQLTDAIDQAVRQGSHSVVLDLTRVSYVSSAGIGALVRAHKQFQSIRGFFGVGIAPPHVEEVIRMTGLAKMLLCDMEKVRRSSGNIRSTMQPMFRVSAEAGMTFELYDIHPKAELACEVLGQPAQLPRGTYQPDDCAAREFPVQTFGLGLGAFGRDFADCSNRFGEFLAAGGAAAYLPTSGAGKPDYQLAQGDFVPQVQIAYGLRCTGELRQLHRFEPADDDSRVPLSTLVEQCLSLSEADVAGMILVAETSGLIGTALRRSPTTAATQDESRLSHPEIRRWLSFSPERSHTRSLALIVGIASRGDPARRVATQLAPLLRPLRTSGDLFGHFHAAVFSYRPFKKRKLELADTVAALFDSEDLQDVLHLLNDDREIIGGGESEFVRGACWVGPISSVTGGLSP